jgi:hypothetical protein
LMAPHKVIDDVISICDCLIWSRNTTIHYG